MKNAIIPYIIILTFFVSCTTINHPKWLCNKRVDIQTNNRDLVKG
jgi:hypothetical protein